MYIDRAYVSSLVVDDLLKAKGKVFAKPWEVRAVRPGMFTKRNFNIDLQTGTITCPEGQVEPFEPGNTVELEPEACGACPRRDKCTTAASGRGRAVSIAEDEAVQKRFRTP